MKILYLFLFFLSLLSKFNYSRGQSSDVSGLRLVLIPTQEILINDSDTINSPLILSDSLTYKIQFNCSQLDSISKIHVKVLGDTLNINLFEKYFELNEIRNQVHVFQQDGDLVSIIIGMHKYHSPIYIEMKLEYDGEVYSDTIILETLN